MTKAIKKRGKPAGMRAAQIDIQRPLYEHPDRANAVEAVYRAALDDDHKHQAAAMKILMDRMLPISFCDKDSEVRQSINITISGIETQNDDEKVVN